MATKPEIRNVDEADAGKPGPLRYRTAISPDGKTVRIRLLDPNAPTFTADFLSSFKANVRRARAESKERGLDVK